MIVALVIMMVLGNGDAAGKCHRESTESYRSEHWFHEFSCAPFYDSVSRRGVASRRVRSMWNPMSTMILFRVPEQQLRDVLLHVAKGEKRGTRPDQSMKGISR
jgi:hypothetical protein